MGRYVVEQTVVNDRRGESWEYMLLSAGALELGKLRQTLRGLEQQGWSIDTEFEARTASSRDKGELLIWLRRPLVTAALEALAA